MCYIVLVLLFKIRLLISGDALGSKYECRMQTVKTYIRLRMRRIWSGLFCFQFRHAASKKLSRDIVSPTRLHLHPMEVQISLGVRTGWSVSAVRPKTLWILDYPEWPVKPQIRLRMRTLMFRLRWSHMSSWGQMLCLGSQQQSPLSSPFT